MLERIKRVIRHVLKVPAEPEAPFGAAGTVQVFRASPGYFRYRLLSWGLTQAGTIFGIVFFFLVVRPYVDFKGIHFVTLLEALGVVSFLTFLPISFLIIRLDYEYRWYMITDRSLRIREGLFKIQERTMTFSNIQNVSIRRGPIQRFFGIADLVVRTAGGGSEDGSGGHGEQSDNLHLGYFKGVANAPEIRDTVLERLRHLRTAGLGDPDDSPGATAKPPTSEEPSSSDSTSAATSASTSTDGDVLAAAQLLLGEARALKHAVSR
ncbi:MAG: PH domain-containing protein [Acidobacteriota bacterium]